MNQGSRNIRKPLVAANWKMNTLPSQTQKFISSLLNYGLPSDVDVLICPPFTHLMKMKQLATGKNILIGAQNCHEKLKGAYTGEISAEMLSDISCEYVIIGHSERRNMYITENELISQKINVAIHAGLKIIYCCGESLIHREQNIEKEFIYQQLQKDLFTLSDEEIKSIDIAYEPVWAIGTGKHASPEQAEEMHRHIRKTIDDHFPQLGDKLRILYGGSVNLNNIQSYATIPDIDGVLVGGASLIAEDFGRMVSIFGTESR